MEVVIDMTVRRVSISPEVSKSFDEILCNPANMEVANSVITDRQPSGVNATVILIISL
jgi:hypothetical protein